MPGLAALTVHAMPHPDAPVRQAGFPLDHPYLEQCWTAFIGPTSVLLLRRLPVLWREGEPAVVQAGDLARSLALGSRTDPKSRFWKVLARLDEFGFAARPGDDVLEVYATVRPLTPRQVERLPAYDQGAHRRLLGAHLDQIAAATSRTDPVGYGRVTTRLDQLERPPRIHTLGLRL